MTTTTEDHTRGRLPNPNNPQKGDRFSDRSSSLLTVRHVGRKRAFVEYEDGDEASWSLEWIADYCTPAPPPTPGPDELWVAYDEPGDRAYWAYRTMQDAVEGEICDVPIVRYVKADDQNPGGQP